MMGMVILRIGNGNGDKNGNVLKSYSGLSASSRMSSSTIRYAWKTWILSLLHKSLNINIRLRIIIRTSKVFVTLPPVVAIKLAFANHSLSVWSPEYLNSSGCCKTWTLKCRYLIWNMTNEIQIWKSPGYLISSGWCNGSKTFHLSMPIILKFSSKVDHRHNTRWSFDPPCECEKWLSHLYVKPSPGLTKAKSLVGSWSEDKKSVRCQSARLPFAPLSSHLKR